MHLKNVMFYVVRWWRLLIWGLLVLLEDHGINYLGELIVTCKEKLKPFFSLLIFLGCIPTPEGKKYYFILKEH